MTTQLKNSLVYPAALCCALAATAWAKADWFYDFQTPPPPSFVTVSNPPSGTFSATVGNGVLHLSDTTLPADGGARLGAGLETSQVFTDVRVSGTLNPTGTTNNLLNLNARFDFAGTGYTAGIDFTAGYLQIAKVVGRPVEIVQSSDDSEGNQPLLQNLATSYFLQMDIVGHHVTARVFDVEGGTQLLVVTYTDTGVGGPPFESGIAGMSSVSSSGTVDGTFGPVHATAILP